MARDAEELADGRDVTLAVGAVETFGDVEDEVRPDEREPRRESCVGLEAVNLPTVLSARSTASMVAGSSHSA